MPGHSSMVPSPYPRRDAGVPPKMITFQQEYYGALGGARTSQATGMPSHRSTGGDPIEAPRDGRPVYVMRLRVRHYETDALGHVNNAVYLNYLEQAAIEHAAAMGFGQARLAELGGFFVVRRHEIDYL